MNIPITIDTSSIAQRFAISKDNILNMVDNISKGLAVAYAEALKEEALNVSGSKGARYAELVKVIDSQRLVGTVIVDYSKDPLIGKMDQGSGPFDMKPGFLKSPKAKLDKNGKRFISIPMRWATPGAVGDSGTFSNNMPKPIHDIIKKKEVKGSIRVNELPNQFKDTTVRPKVVDNKGITLFEEYQRKSSIYAGIAKVQDPVTGQNRYMSFRRVSDKSDPNSWIHPGFTAMNLTQKALNNFNIQHNLTILIDNELGRLGLI